MTALILFASSFLVVFFLGAQSLLVNNGRYGYAFVNSLLIGASQLGLYKLAPDATAVLDVGAYLFGGPFGVVAAMYVLRHLHRRP